MIKKGTIEWIVSFSYYFVQELTV